MTQLKLISREPTEEQLEAALNSDVGALDSTLRELYALIYQAMVDAAPDSETEAEKMASVFIKSEDERKTVVGRTAPGVKQYYEALEIIRALLAERRKI